MSHLGCHGPLYFSVATAPKLQSKSEHDRSLGWNYLHREAAISSSGPTTCPRQTMLPIMPAVPVLIKVFCKPAKERLGDQLVAT